MSVCHMTFGVVRMEVEIKLKQKDGVCWRDERLCILNRNDINTDGEVSIPDIF